MSGKKAIAQAGSGPKALDFFAGGGLATSGLKSHFNVIWANDICPKKAKVYCVNHGVKDFHLGPIEDLLGKDLPVAMLSWASFPCQDLSIAGNLEGINSKKSGLVWQWIRVMDEMKKRPPIVVAENVPGLVTSARGSNYRMLHNALCKRGYKVGAVMLNAINFVPQSRPRIFVVAVLKEIETSEHEEPVPAWCHPSSITRAAEGLRDRIWWRVNKPSPKNNSLMDIIDFNAPLHDDDKSAHNLNLIPQKHRAMLDQTVQGKKVMAFPGYKRTRNGRQVLELRFDETAGCLRTPGGGSSRQFLVIWRNGRLNTRLFTVQETARLMGAEESYLIPGTYNDGYKAMGDGVVAPVVEHLAACLLRPLSDKVKEEERRKTAPQTHKTGMKQENG